MPLAESHDEVARVRRICRAVMRVCALPAAVLLITTLPASAQGATLRAAAKSSTTQATSATEAAVWTDEQKALIAAEVRLEFLHAWRGYRQYAWGRDELLPLSKGFKDWYGTSLYMTPVDALDTLILMGLNEQADETRELVAKNLSFDKDIYVKNFEITIRMMGGLLSSYQLTGDRRLLALAKDLGDRLLPAFNSPTGMPYVFVNLKTGAVRGVETNPAHRAGLKVDEYVGHASRRIKCGQQPITQVLGQCQQSPVTRKLVAAQQASHHADGDLKICLLYTSDAADEEDSVDLGGR